MRSLAITRISTVNALGIGLKATTEALLGNRSGCRPCDYEDAMLDTYIGRVDGVENHKLTADLSDFDCRNNRLADMALAADGFDAAVAQAVDRYGSAHIGTVLGTTTSGMREGEYAFAARDPQSGALPESFNFAGTVSYHSLTQFVQARLGLTGPGFTVSTACSSSAKVFVDAAQLIDAGLCEAVVVGGTDSLCLLKLYGFDSLQLLSGAPCRPNDVNRAGISIGEGAGFALVERTGNETPALVNLVGYGESTDAHHISAPHPQGLGAQLSMRAALEHAGIHANKIDYVNQHGTGTRQNDILEDMAIARVFGDGMRCSSTKGATGHALGAAGIIEAAVCAIAVTEGLLPGNINLIDLDPEFRCKIVGDTQPGDIRYALSNSFGFGGNNCSLIFGRPDC
jgi:3-oxoacyl-[acyl-carrier-protein] synthase-1